MKIIVLLASLFVLFSSCKDSSDNYKTPLKSSQGDFNHLTLVVSDSLWNSNIGDSIRKYIAYPLDGVLADEPQFTITQLSPRIFVDKNKLARNLILFSDSESCLFSFERSKFATPQNVFKIFAPSADEMIDEFIVNVDSIISVVHDFEINEKQHQINREAKLDVSRLQYLFGIKMLIPQSFKFVLEKEDFIWIKKDVGSGNSNLIFYEVPINRIENQRSVIENIVEVKDSVAALYIQGKEYNSYMKSDEGFMPFNKEVALDQLKAVELKGTWDMKNSFMSGSYLSYAIRDEYYNRYLFVEGFTYNPSLSKRHLLFELEAIIKTISFFEIL